MGETEREMDGETQGERENSSSALGLLHTHTVWAAYVLRCPRLLAEAEASAPATLPRAMAAYVRKVGAAEGRRGRGGSADG